MIHFQETNPKWCWYFFGEGTFESGYVYYDLTKQYNMTINEFALTHAQMGMPRPPNSVFHKNNQLRDMGLDVSLFENKTEVINKIEQLDKVIILSADKFSSIWQPRLEHDSFHLASIKLLINATLSLLLLTLLKHFPFQ